MVDEFEASMERGAAATRALYGKAPAPGAAAGGASAALSDRQKEIMEHPHGKGRHRELAAHLAHKTDMPALAAIATMNAAEMDSAREDRARGD